jgi:hypothetical protein
MRKEVEMPRQLYWEDVDVGTEGTPVRKIATTQKLVMWAGASGDFNPLHYQESFAQSRGMPAVLVHGRLKAHWLLHLMENWIGEEGRIKKLSCQYRAQDYPRKMNSELTYEEGETWWCKGVITQKYVQDGEHMVDCDIWVENGKGEKTTPGKATVVLPSKKAK